MPVIAKKLVESIPPGTTVDKFFENYHKYWLGVSSFASILLLRLTNLPDPQDYMVSELSAEVAREIKTRYSEGNEFTQELGLVKNESFTLLSAMTLLDKDQLLAFSKLVRSLPEELRKLVLSYKVSSKEDAKNLLVTLASCTEDEFLVWAEIIPPLKPLHVETEFEKNVKESLKTFRDDCNSFFQKESWLEKQAAKIKNKHNHEK